MIESLPVAGYDRVSLGRDNMKAPELDPPLVGPAAATSDGKKFDILREPLW